MPASLAASDPPSRSPGREIVVFQLDERSLALPLPDVEHVVRMAQPTPLSAAPAIVLGVLDLGGAIVPVLDIRQRLGLPARAPRAADSLIVAHTPRRRVALAVDRVEGILPLAPDAFIPAEQLLPELPHLAGVARVPGRDVILIQSLERFLSWEEEALLDAALQSDAR